MSGDFLLGPAFWFMIAGAMAAGLVLAPDQTMAFLHTAYDIAAAVLQTVGQTLESLSS